MQNGNDLGPPKQILPPYTVKTVTDNVEFIQMLSRYGLRIACSHLEEINTALQKMTSSHISLPDNIQRRVGTTLAWDNIDHLKETFQVKEHRIE